MATDYFRNQRRQAQRRIAKLEQQNTRQSRAKIRELKHLQEMTKARTASGRRRSEKVRAEAAAKLEQRNLDLSKQVFGRKASTTRASRKMSDKVMERQLSLATGKGKELSLLNETEVRQFYAEHKRVYATADFEQRNKKIKEFYKVDTLQEAFEKWKANREKRKELEAKRARGEELTDEEKAQYESFTKERDETEDKYEIYMITIVDAAIENA